MTGILSAVLAIPWAAAAGAAAAGPDDPDALVITADRAGEPLARAPADISVVAGRRLADQGATDLAGALSLVPGVEAPSGGDAGPASAVPSFWGLHEFDAFLLVEDGVPWGGAFNPALTTLDLNDVQRIEVLKGAAPVTYGATAFVGVIQALHYPAGEAANTAEVALGSFGSWRGALSTVLPEGAGYRQSVSLDGGHRGYADDRESVGNAHLLYRGALAVADGELRVDANLFTVRARPPSPVLRLGATLAPQTPIDANFNPADAHIDEDKVQLAVGYTRESELGRWEALLSYAYSDTSDVRAFLHPDLTGSADTQQQRRYIDDGYLDTHLVSALARTATLTLGADLLYGHARQSTLNGNDAYTVPLDGSVLPPPAASLPINERGALEDWRWFGGLYAQYDWRPDPRWTLDVGARFNDVAEHKDSSDLLLPDALPADASLAAASVSRRTLRGTWTAAASFQAWQHAADELVIYADYRQAFKPAAIDFGPDYTPDLLRPETARGYEAGLKGSIDDAHLRYEAELFWLDFSNLVVATPDGSLANAAGERLRGVELEARYQPIAALSVVGNVALHDARYTQYLFADGTAGVDVSGNRLPLSPRLLAAAGVDYAPSLGWGMSVLARYVGPRQLDEENTAPVGGYVTCDAQVSFGLRRLRVALDATNLTDQRPAVTASEFGSQSYYLLPARALWLRLTHRL